MKHRVGSRHRPDRGRWRLVARLLLGMLAAAALALLLVGVPWGLTVYVGWPLPDHLPTIDELRGVAFAPMSPYLFLDILACACWLAWAAFAIDVALCMVETTRLRRPPLPARSPLRMPAATLISLVVVALIVIRDLATGPALLVTDVAPAVHTVSAPLIPGSPDHQTINDVAGLDDEHPTPTSVIVRAPRDGVHDSLWRIAKRTLGEGRRWPEIFELNKGTRQPYGQIFLRPSLIYPGQELRLPDATRPLTPTPNRSDPTPDPNPPSLPPTPSPTAPPTSVPDPTQGVSQPPGAPAVEPSPVVNGSAAPDNDLVDHLLVGSAVAAAVAGAVVAVRRRNRRRYRPGSGERRDLPVAPVIRRLTAADPHELDDRDDLDDLDDGREFGSAWGNTGPLDGEAESRVGEVALVELPDADGVGTGLVPAIGAARGRELAIRLAAARGLGLVGEGAEAAMRAILLASVVALRDDPPGKRGLVILVGPVGHRLVGSARNPLIGTATEPDLNAAAERVETWLVERVAGGEGGAPPRNHPPIVLVVESPPDAEHHRLQSILDNGAQVEVAGLVLGQWRPGITLYVRADGIVSAASPGPGRQLVGARLFHLDEPAAADIFDLLHDADTPPPGPTPDILGPEAASADAMDEVNHGDADDETVANNRNDASYRSGDDSDSADDASGHDHTSTTLDYVGDLDRSGREPAAITDRGHGDGAVDPWRALVEIAAAGGGLGLAGPGATAAARALLCELILADHRNQHGATSMELIGVASAVLDLLGLSASAVPDRTADAVRPRSGRPEGGHDTSAHGRMGERLGFADTGDDRTVLVRVPDQGGEGLSTDGHGVSAPAVRVVVGPLTGGVTVYVRRDGVVGAAGPPHLAAQLIGRRLPLIDTVAAAGLLDLAIEIPQPPPSVSDSSPDGGATASDASAARTATGHHEQARPPGPVRDATLADPSTTAAQTATGSHDSVHESGALIRSPWMFRILGHPALLVRTVPERGAPASNGTRHTGSAAQTGAPVSAVEPVNGWVDVTARLSPRVMDLLVFLALHPHGVRRDAAVAAMWPDTGRSRPHNNLSALVSRLQSSLRAIAGTHHVPPLVIQDGGGHEAEDPARIVATDGSIYRLNPALVEVDYWTFLAATAAARTDELAATKMQQPHDDASSDLVRDLSTAHALYVGPLADGVDHEWILSVREAARRSYLAMTAQLVRHHLLPAPNSRGSSSRAPEAAQIGAAGAILEAARNIEPTNQAIYRDILALQLRSGNNEAASHTVGLLISQLDDIGEQPDPETHALIDQVNRTRAG